MRFSGFLRPRKCCNLIQGFFRMNGNKDKFVAQHKQATAYNWWTVTGSLAHSMIM